MSSLTTRIIFIFFVTDTRIIFISIEDKCIIIIIFFFWATRINVLKKVNANKRKSTYNNNLEQCFGDTQMVKYITDKSSSLKSSSLYQTLNGNNVIKFLDMY